MVHGIATLAAGVVLFVAPGAIPAAAGITLDPSAYLLAYLLGAAEISLAVLSFGSARLDPADHARRLVAIVFVVFHLATALGELLASTHDHGIGGVVWANVVARVVFAGFFVALARGPGRGYRAAA